MNQFEETYSSAQARAKLNASTSTFKRYIDSGKIRKIIPPNRKQGMYAKADVDRMVEEMRPFTSIGKQKRKNLNEKQRISTSLDWQRISDLPAILKLDLTVYKENIVGDIGLYISWEKKNPKITILSFERNNRDNVLAYISLVPLPEHIILAILKGEREEVSISANEIETYERKGGYVLLAESVVMHPDHPEQLYNLLKEVLNYWYEQYPDRYIEKIYADAVSDNGDILARKLFFSPLYDVSNTAYVLDLKKPGITKIIKNFQESLRQKEVNIEAK
jgi:hypothetical protein